MIIYHNFKKRPRPMQLQVQQSPARSDAKLFWSLAALTTILCAAVVELFMLLLLLTRT